MKRRAVLWIIGVSIVVGAPFVLPFFVPWSRIHCREEEIDLHSGLKRKTVFVYWIPIHQAIGETALSHQLGAARQDDSNQWEPVNTFGPYLRHSPHYIYHSAFHQIRVLELIWQEFGMNPEQRRETCLQLLREWQVTASDSSADRYLSELADHEERSR